MEEQQEIMVILNVINMKRYEVTLQFDSELEEEDVEQAMTDFLNNDCYVEVVEEYPDVEDIDADGYSDFEDIDVDYD